MLHGIPDLTESFKIYHITTQIKVTQNIASAIHSSITIPMCTITGLYNTDTVMTSAVLSRQEGIHGLNPAQGPQHLWNSFASGLAFTLSVGLSHICRSGWLRETFTLLKNSVRNIYITSWSTQLVIIIYFKQSYPLVPFVLRLNQFLCLTLWASWAHDLGLSPLSLLSLQEFIDSHKVAYQGLPLGKKKERFFCLF